MCGSPPHPAAVAAARYHPDLAAFYRHLRDAGKPAKLALTAVMRKLIVLANTLLRQDRTFQLQAPIHAGLPTDAPATRVATVVTHLAQVGGGAVLRAHARDSLTEEPHALWHVMVGIRAASQKSRRRTCSTIRELGKDGLTSG